MTPIAFSTLLLGFLGLILFPLAMASRRRERISQSEALAAWERVVEKQSSVRASLEQLAAQLAESRRTEEQLEAEVQSLVQRIDEQVARGPNAHAQHDVDQQAAALMSHLGDLMEKQVRDGKHAFNEAANDLAAASSDSARALATYQGLALTGASRSEPELSVSS